MTNRKNWLPSVSTCWTEFGPELYRELVAENIHHVEFTSGPIDRFEEIDFVHRAKEYVAEMHDFEIIPGSIHLPFSPAERMDPTLEDAAMREDIVRTQGELLRAAADAGFPIAVIHPSGERHGAFQRAERMKNALETLHKISDIANECGIKLCIENLPRACLCNVKEEMQMMLQELPSVYACFDTNHSLRQPNPEFIRALKGKVIALHVSDFDLIDERHLLPFLGRNDWHEIMTALEEIDYEGLFNFEISSNGVLTAHNITLAYNKLMEI